MNEITTPFKGETLKEIDRQDWHVKIVSEEDMEREMLLYEYPAFIGFESFGCGCSYQGKEC